MYKRIYDSEEITVDYCNDGKPMIRVSVFEDGHLVDEHFVELPEDVEPVVRCKDCGKSREWGNEGTLLCYRDETTIHVVKPDAYCDGSQQRCAADDPEVLKFEPVVHARYDSEHCCTNCGEMALEAPIAGTYYHTLRCWACNAKMDKE